VRTALRFAALARKKQLFEAGKSDSYELLRQRILPGLVEFEALRGGLAEPVVSSGFRVLLKIARAGRCPDLEGLIALRDAIIPGTKAGLRLVPAEPLCRAHVPFEPAAVGPALDRFFEWTRSPGFAEMHVVAQVTVTQIRLHEIYPFGEGTEVAVSLFAHWFLLAQGYLLPAYGFADAAEFDPALQAGLEFRTEDLVNLNLRALGRAYNLGLEDS
jgi:hypothetical protein